MNASHKENVLLLDYCSEKNRGDAAMQAGLINLVKKYYPHASIKIISVFGANQIRDLLGEYDHSAKTLIPILGGLKPTFYPLGVDEERPELFTEILNTFFFLPAAVFLFFLYLGLPVSLAARLLPSVFRKTFQAMQEADLVIWNGRNFRSRGNPVLEIYRTFHVIFHPLICAALSRPMACIGASVWELNNSASRNLLRFAFNKCFFISLREQNSYRATQNLLGPLSVERIHLLPDLSFADFEKRKTIIEKRNPLGASAGLNRIGITLVDWHTDGENIRQAYKEAIKELIRSLVKGGAQVVIIPQVTKKWENIDRLLGDLGSTLSPSEWQLVQVQKGEPDVAELLEIYSQFDFLVATRMHSAIFASAVQTPLVAIAYDSGGKWNILEGLGYEEFIISYSKVTSTVLLERIMSCWEARNVVLSKVESNVAKNIDQVEQNVSLLSGALKSVNKDASFTNAV